MSLIPVYRPRPSALHAARAGVGAAFCCALALTGALYRHPLVLGATLAAVVAAGLLAGVGREIGRSLLLALPLALLVTIVNPLVYAEGDTLLVRGGELLGRRFDITLEAILYGALDGPARDDRSWSRSGCCRRRSTPMRCCASSGASPTARRSPPHSPTGSSPCSPATQCAWATPPAAGHGRQAASRSCAPRSRGPSTARSTWRPRSRCAATRWAAARRGAGGRGRDTTSPSWRPRWPSPRWRWRERSAASRGSSPTRPSIWPGTARSGRWLPRSSCSPSPRSPGAGRGSASEGGA